MIEGFEIHPAEHRAFGDVMIIDRNGGTALVEIKAGDQSFAGIDLGQAWAELTPAAEAGSHRVDAVYADIETWAQEYGLIASRDRTVPMSEELMQRFAVPDRDMPILDISDGSRPLLSMVPAGF